MHVILVGLIRVDFRSQPRGLPRVTRRWRPLAGLCWCPGPVRVGRVAVMRRRVLPVRVQARHISAEYAAACVVPCGGGIVVRAPAAASRSLLAAACRPLPCAGPLLEGVSSGRGPPVRGSGASCVVPPGLLSGWGRVFSPGSAGVRGVAPRSAWGGLSLPGVALGAAPHTAVFDP